MSKTSILDKLQAPEGWGVEQRGRTRADFKVAIWPTLVALVLIASTCLLLVGGKPLSGWNKEDAELMAGMTILLTIITTVFAMHRIDTAWDMAGNTAVLQAQQKFSEWQTDTLIPFLESKHGVEIRRRGADREGREWMRRGFTAVHPERGSITVRLQGIIWNHRFVPNLSVSEEWDYSLPPVPQFYEEPWLEEIISPATVSFRRLEVISE